MSWKRPQKTWTTKELVHLVIPIPGTARRANFEKEYYDRTGYQYDGIIPLDHSLMLITGLYRPKQARTKAKEYLAHGVWCFASKSFFTEFNIPHTEAILAEAEAGLNPNWKAHGVVYSQQLPSIAATISAMEQAIAVPMELRKFTEHEAEQYLQKFRAGLTSWQFIGLAQMLAATKETLHAAAGRRNRRSKKN